MTSLSKKREAASVSSALREGILKISSWKDRLILEAGTACG
jgi:hypothetical protein